MALSRSLPRLKSPRSAASILLSVLSERGIVNTLTPPPATTATATQHPRVHPQPASGQHQPLLFLGLDVSAQSTGYAVLRSPRGDLVEWGRIDTHRKDVLNAGRTISGELKALRRRLDADEGGGRAPPPLWRVSIEDFMRAYSSSHWNTKALFTLAQINAIVAYECTNLFGGMPPAKFHPSTPRAFYSLHTKRQAQKQDNGDGNMDRCLLCPALPGRNIPSVACLP